MATPILTYSPSGPALRTVTPPPVVTALTVETEEETVNPGNPTPILEYHPSGGAPVPPWPPAPTDLTYPECGTIQLVSGQSWIDVTFANEKPDANWIFEDLQVVNTTDPTYLNIWPGLVTVKSVTGFRVQLNGLPNTDNYFLHWAVGGCATSDWVVGGAPAATNFLQLTDTPDDYTGQSGMGVKVNATEDGLEFGVVAGGGVAINVVDYGAVADCQMLDDITMTAGSAVVHSTSYSFVAGDVGKYVVIRGAVGATDSISPLHGTIVSVSGGDATLSQATSAFPAGAFTPQMDFGTDNVGPFQNAIIAMPAGGTVVMPAGRYMLGASTWNVGAGLFHAVGFPMNGLFEDQFPATAAGATLRGDGMGATKLYYSSSFALVGGDSSGCGILVGLTPAGGYTGISISDFSLTDLNPFAQDGGTGISVYGVDNFRLERVEMINCKGNSAFNYQGAAIHVPSPGGGAYGVNIFIRDCIARGDAAAGWINGDGFNVGNVRNFHFTGNTVRGVQRHGFEGGGSCYNQFFENNYIDMDSQGGAGINPTGGSQTIVANNIILNVANGSTGIDFTTDVGDFSIADIIVTGNYITGGQFAVKFQKTGGGSGEVDRYIVSNNRMEGCGDAIAVGIADIMVHNNRIVLSGGGFDMVLFKAGGSTAPTSASQLIDIRGNVVNAGAILYNEAQYQGFDDAYQTRVEDNTVGAGMEDAVGGTYGNLGRVYSPTGGSLAAGGVLTGLTALPVNMLGARSNDSVEVIPGPNWPKNLIYYGAVTATDTVTVLVFNPTTGAVSYPAASLPASPNFIYYAVHRK